MMNYLYAILPISGLAVAISLGGTSAPLSLVSCVLFSLCIGREHRYIAVFFCTASLLVRYMAMFATVRSVLGDITAIVFVLLCLSVSLASAWHGGARYAAGVAFYMSVILALYTAWIGFCETARALPIPSIFECVAAVLCPLGAVIAVRNGECATASKRAKSVAIGVLLSSVFILFPNRLTEFGLLSVPITVIVGALECGAVMQVFSADSEHKIV